MHNKIKTYNIPVDLVKSIGIKIEATNQFEAIKKVSNYLNSNETIKDKFSSHKIIGQDITCDQDDEIMDEISKDFNLDIKTSDDRETITHRLLPNWGANFPKIESEVKDEKAGDDKDASI